MRIIDVVINMDDIKQKIPSKDLILMLHKIIKQMALKKKFARSKDIN